MANLILSVQNTIIGICRSERLLKRTKLGFLRKEVIFSYIPTNIDIPLQDEPPGNNFI